MDKYTLIFPELTNQIRLAWKDLQEATEHGAVCVAIILIINKTKYTVIERAVKKTGIDYWLGEKDKTENDLPFNKSARLEVSGILQGNNKHIQKRLNLKLDQTKQSDSTKLPKFIAIVEFSKPLIKLVKS